ncbi:divalent-cation tolerance protein CutA [Lysobacter sp. A3-1-A15]|uniref:divalent-cation tolerance protein CutA n=1 Tax=Novilysobacter viscosus TaxID=3098602 RepID=UPI002ED85248
MSVVIVHCACPDAATADRLARALVDERLAACASVLPGMRSTYRWQGRVEQADEVLLLAKTTDACLQACTDRLQAMHPYELPEVIAVEAAGGLLPYLAWVADETRPDPLQTSLQTEPG